MTGTYASFKGKLKVGDRVKINGYRFEVERIAESYFKLWGHEKVLFWHDTGTLELLSPSPRVVTEPIEADDVDADFKRMFTDFIDRYVNDLQRLNTKLDEALKRMDAEPVQPASPPAPAEEEWWHDEKYWEEEDTSEIEAMSYPRIAEIVAEAMRRGAEEAWKEARSIVQRKLDECLSDTAESCYELLLTEFPNEEALNKPVTNGEK